MPLLQTPSFRSTKYSLMNIDKPCFGGVNYQDLEYKLKENQSPNSINMMYRNGAFGKRYGQKVEETYENTIFRIGQYNGDLIIHSGTEIYKGDDKIFPAEGETGVPATPGTFINFNKKLYYLCGNNYYQYDGETFKEVEAYCPDVIINRKPDPANGKGDRVEEFNRIGAGFKQTFDGDGTSTLYKLHNGDQITKIDKHTGDGTTTTYELEFGGIVDAVQEVRINGSTVDSSTYSYTKPNITFTTAPSVGANVEIRYYYYNFLPYDNKTPVITVISSDGERILPSTEFTFDRFAGTVTFTTAPASGTNNVVIQAYRSDEDTVHTITRNKYWCAYGGSNNSRLFLAGGGDSNYYYSDVYDATYFPMLSYGALGNTEEDITGFGEQYDTLIIFKPKETFSLSYTTSTDDDGNLQVEFTSLIVNSRIGCDCPNTIQLINNLLVWCNTEFGVCTLVSTNIEDERNIRFLSYNIESGFRETGLLNENDLEKAISCDWQGKYFLTVNGKVYCWDYLLTPFWASYLSSSAGQNNEEAKRLSWFIFDNFEISQYQGFENELYFSKENKLCKLSKDFNDFGEPIIAVYQTPLYQFGAVDYLKTIKNIFVQARDDTASVINIKYITEENPEGEDEQEPIRIGAKLWSNFSWSTFEWLVVNFGNVFRRKCSMKKVQMFGMVFINDEVNRDMSISNIGIEYRVVKEIK